MNPLIDGLPNSITIDGEEYAVNTDFRTGLLIEEVLKDDWESDVDLITQIIVLYLGTDVHFRSQDSVVKAVKDLMQFYRIGKPVEDDEEKQGSSDRPIMSFKHDAEYIYSAFLQSYRIDLFEDELHWWKFNALLKSLPEDTMLMKIIGYRSEKITGKMSKERKQFLQKMKTQFKLPLEEKEQEQMDELTKALMSGKGILEALK